MKPSWHYYEAHINLGEIGTSHLNILMNTLSQIGFSITDLVRINHPDATDPEDFDLIITSKGTNLQDFTEKLKRGVVYLKEKGFDVQRYKIESTIFDSKYEDKLGLL